MADKKTKLNIVALTTCCVDFYPQLNKSFMGGNSLNVASMWKKLDPDSNISVITCLGNDSNGKMISNFFQKIGIDTTRVYTKNGINACNQLRVDENGERFGIEGTWQGGVYESFYLSNADWEWVSQQNIVAIPANNPNFSTMLKRRHNSQMLSVDYLDIENNIPIEDSIAKTDIAFITARTELLPKYKELAYKTKKLIVVTLGHKGSYTFYNGETYYQPAIQVPKVIDTTGCGDAYQAAFALTFYSTQNIKDSMYAGAMAASQILQEWGGVGKIL